MWFALPSSVSILGHNNFYLCGFLQIQKTEVCDPSRPFLDNNPDCQLYADL